MEWRGNTFILAPNAYGKSTLVNILKSLRDRDPKPIRARRTLGCSGDSEAVVIVDSANRVYTGTDWDKAYPCIQVFDVPYIQENILSREIELVHRKCIHKIIIGAKGIGIDTELTALKTEEKEKRQQLSALEKQFSDGGFVYEREAFLAIPSGDETAVQARVLKLEQDIKAKESESQIRSLGYPKALSAPLFELNETKTLAGRKLASVHDAAEKRVLNHIGRNIKAKDQAREFIRHGLDMLQADCPFCGQDLSGATELDQATLELLRRRLPDVPAGHKQTGEIASGMESR